MMPSVNEIMWRTQDILHKKPQVVPGTLLLLSSSLLAYRHVMHSGPEHESDPIRTFLALILVQMLPLVALEMKIMQCADPVGLFCKFAMPVTLTHAFFLGMRLANYPLYETKTVLCSGAGLVGALLAMRLGYRQSWVSMLKCSTMWNLVCLAFMASIATTSLDEYLTTKPDWMEQGTWEEFFYTVLQTSNSYIEIVAFVPAVWIVYREDKSAGRVQVESTDTTRTATAFFLFLVIFYVGEDLLNAYEASSFSMLASIAHVAHFILLLDFCFYILAHIYNPEKLVGELRRWLPVDIYHEV